MDTDAPSSSVTGEQQMYVLGQQRSGPLGNGGLAAVLGSIAGGAAGAISNQGALGAQQPTVAGPNPPADSSLVWLTCSLPILPHLWTQIFNSCLAFATAAPSC